MGGAWSCCLPCAGGGGGGGGAAVSGATPEAKKSSALLKYQQYQQPHQQKKGQLYEQPQSKGQLEQQRQHHHQQQRQQQCQQPKHICVAHVRERAPLSDLDEDLVDLDDEKEGEFRSEEEDHAKEGGTQHRLSPRLHDIEEEDDEEGRNVRERSVILRIVEASLAGSSRFISAVYVFLCRPLAFTHAVRAKATWRDDVESSCVSFALLLSSPFRSPPLPACGRSSRMCLHCALFTGYRYTIESRDIAWKSHRPSVSGREVRKQGNTS